MDEKQISELLECSVCLEPFDQNCKVLPCQHTFCRRCLDEISLTKLELRCPECRALVTQKVADLPTNILVVRILEGLKTQGYKASMGRDGGKFPLGQLGKAGSSPTRQQGLSPHKTRSDARAAQSGHHFRQGQSFAKALYDYESNEKEDLNFKKGDIIQLRRQIDENWYHGELSGKTGCFPANFVKIIIPLPQVPQSRALYDFDLKDENEKDCLTFQKDEILTVIRRVDDNWLEGRKGDKIGIFPITFVELNDAARVLISTKTNVMMPPTPATSVPVSTNCPIVTTAPDESSLSVSPPLTSTSLISLSGPPLFSEPQQDTTCETTTVITQSKLSPPSSNQSSSSTITTTLSTVSVMPSTSSNLLEELIVESPQNKRHSYSSSPSRFSPVLSNTTSQQRHSMEVTLNVESSQSLLNVPSSNSTALDITTGNTISSNVGSSSMEKSTGLSLPPQLSPSPANIIEIPDDIAPPSQGNQSDNIQPLPPSTPLYVAIYNYFPQKDDELELQKGDQYIVVEKCQDGWFKGSCIKTGESGVFPGNYVSIMRHSSAKPVNPNVLNIRAKVPISSTASSLHSNPLVSNNAQQQMIVGNSTSLSSAQSQGAPPLLPRVPKTNTSGQKSRQFAAPPMRSMSSPITTSVSHGLKHGITDLSSSTRTSLGSIYSPHAALPTSPAHRPWASSASFHHAPGSHATTLTPPNVGMATSLDSHFFFGGGQEKDKKKKKDKEKRGLLKLLKDRKSKSPSTEADTNLSAQATIHDSVAHQRCGSFPSDVNASTVIGGESNSVPPHRKSVSLDSTPPPPIPLKPRPRPLPRERYCCIVPYPPQTDYELSLELGDIIHVHRKREDGWYKGTQERTGKTGMFPASFVEKCT